jgi:hypothetical protein
MRPETQPSFEANRRRPGFDVFARPEEPQRGQAVDELSRMYTYIYLADLNGEGRLFYELSRRTISQLDWTQTKKTNKETVLSISSFT